MAARGAPFITIEGGEGVGKSTLVRGLSERLKARGAQVVATREPGGAPAAEAIRALMLDGPDGRWDAAEEALLAFAARRAHWRGTIAPALAAGAWVLCDRFIDSTRVYQSAAASLVETLAAAAAPDGGWVPDRTLILDVDPETASTRRAARAAENRFDRRDAAFHAGVRDGFRAIADAEPSRCRLIDATAAPDAVLADALRALDDLAADA